jgi:hypothetical protein
MITRTHHGRRFSITALLAGLLAVGAAAPVMAGEPETDPRWLPWLGCWSPVGATEDAAPAVAGVRHVCVTPAPGTAGVDLVSMVDGRIMSRVHIEAAGDRRPVSREGCEGWEQAQWSDAGERVYLRSELTCAGGVERISSGIIAIASPSDWVDVQVIRVRDQRSTRIIRYRSARDTTVVAGEIAAALAGRQLAWQSARMAAASTPDMADVIEASRSVEEAVVEAWLLQRMPQLTIDSRDLRALSGARVPRSVIDLVVALSRPDAFPERLAARGYTYVRIEPPRAAVVVATATEESRRVYVIPSSTGRYRDDRGYPSGYRRYEAYGYIDRHYYVGSGYSRYGLNPYRQYGSYPYYWYTPYYAPYTYNPAPYPVTPRPRDAARAWDPGPWAEQRPAPQPMPQREPAGGRAVQGQGYTRSTGGGSRATAAPPREPSARPQATPAPAARGAASKPRQVPATRPASAPSTRAAKPRPPDAS